MASKKAGKKKKAGQDTGKNAEATHSHKVVEHRELIESSWNIVRKHLLQLAGIIGFSWASVYGLELAVIAIREVSLIAATGIAIFHIFFTALIMLGVLYISLKFAREIPVTLRDLFAPMDHIFHFLGASIVYGVVVLLGLMLFIVPGIYFALLFSQYRYLVFDKKMAPFAALHVSSLMMKGVMKQVGLFWLLLFALNILGAIPFGLGLFVTVPISMIALAKLYDVLRVRYEGRVALQHLEEEAHEWPLYTAAKKDARDSDHDW